MTVFIFKHSSNSCLLDVGKASQEQNLSVSQSYSVFTNCSLDRVGCINGDGLV